MTKEVAGLDGLALPPLSAVAADTEPEPPVRYGYRSFDRQWCLPDNRLGDFIRPVLWKIEGDRQVFLSSLFHRPLNRGPAMVASSVVPDMDTFCGHGAKNQIPMWRDKLATTPNLAVGLTGVLAAAHGTGSPPTEDVVAYVFGLLGTGAYTALFADELGTSAPRVPFTSDRELFAEVVALGRDLLWWATFGERFQPLDGRGRQVTRLPPGTAKNAKAVPATPKGYPESFSYDESTKTIRVGEGEFGPVAPEVWEFDVSGLKVVQSWLAYRMKKRSGKSSSELDTIRPAAWSFSAEFVELLAVIEHFVSATAQAAVLLERVVGGALIDPALFPEPSDEERKSPGRASADDVLTLDLT